MRSKEDTDVQRNLFKVKILMLTCSKRQKKHLTAAGLPNFILMCVSYSMPRHSPIACVLMLLPGSQERQNMRRKIMACAIKIATKIWCFGEEERLSWKWLSTLENWLIYGRIRFREKKTRAISWEQQFCPIIYNSAFLVKWIFLSKVHFKYCNTPSLEKYEHETINSSILTLQKRGW